MSFRNRTVRRSPSTHHAVDRRVLRQEEHRRRQTEDLAAVRVDHAAVRHDDDVAIGVLARRSPPPPSTTRVAEVRSLSPPGRPAPDGLLVPDPMHELRVAGHDLLERQPLPSADVRLDQLVVEHDVEPGGIGVRRDGLAGPAERRAVDGGGRQIHQHAGGQRAARPGAGPPRTTAGPTDRRAPSRTSRRSRSPSGRAGSGRGRGSRRRVPVAGVALAIPRRTLSMSSRSQMRPDASDVSGSGNWPRSRYVTTRRLSHAMISAASATPDDPRHDVDDQRDVVARHLAELVRCSARGWCRSPR